MNVATWIGQILLAGIFLLSGFLKSTMSKDRLLETGQTAAKIVPMPLMRLAAISELVGVLGVILPWATGIARVLTPVAATGFAATMILAAGVHTRLREPKAVTTNAAIFAVAVFVAWSRFTDL